MTYRQAHWWKKQRQGENQDMKKYGIIAAIFLIPNVLNPNQQKTLLSDISKKLKDRPGLHASK
jgi:hypothetical protein